MIISSRMSALTTFDFDNKRVIIVTAHRRENLGKPLENICNALKADCYGI